MKRMDYLKQIMDEAMEKAEEQIQDEREERAKLLMLDCEFNDVPKEMFSRLFKP